VRGKDELADTALAFNEMSAKLMYLDEERVRKEEEIRQLNLELAGDLLELRQLDLAFTTAVTPSGQFVTLFNETRIRPLGMERPLIERLVEDGSYVETSRSPAGAARCADGRCQASDHACRECGVRRAGSDGPGDQQRASMTAPL
jgi:hypothetical protein